MKNKREVFYLEDREKKEDTRVQLIVGILLICGLMLSFYGFYHDISWAFLPLVFGVFVQVFMYLCRKNPMISFGFRLLCCLVFLLFIVLDFSGFVSSFLYFANQCITVWNQRFDTYQTLYQISYCRDIERLMFWSGISIVFSFIFRRFLQKEHHLILTIFVVPFLFLTIVTHTGLLWLGAIFLIMGWYLSWVVQVLEHQYLGKVMLAILILSICCSVLVVGTSQYKQIQSVSDLKENILDGIDQIRYGEDTLPQGDLTKADGLIGDDTKMLQVTFDTAQEVYLRGFVGSDYTGSSWEEANGGIYVTKNATGMLDWLEGQRFQTVYQYAAYKKALDEENAAENKIKVENVGAYRKYVYAPYEIDARNINQGKQEKDWQLQSKKLFGSTEYEFSFMEEDTPTEYMVAKKIDSKTQRQKQYQAAESVYRTFVYENYTTIDEEEKKLLEDFIFKNKDWSEANLYQITSQIRLALQELLVYQDNPTTYDGTKEFTSWALKSGKQGNSASYATIATLAYRAMGIPARYVEGYHLSDADAKELKNEGKKETTLTQKNAHAWTEVYIDEIGWMPIEVVPGYYYADYTTQEILNAPKSSITIQNKEKEDRLQGKTQDQLKSKEEKKDKKETTAEKTVRILGMILLLLFILIGIYLLIQLQQKIRSYRYHKKLETTDCHRVCEMLYDRVCLIFTLDHVEGDQHFPYEYAKSIHQVYEEIKEDEYVRFISLIQKQQFGEQDLVEGEIYAIKAFCRHLTDVSRKQAGKWKAWRMKYIYNIES